MQKHTNAYKQYYKKNISIYENIKHNKNTENTFRISSKT